MQNATYLNYPNKDAIHMIFLLAFRSNYPPRPTEIRRQVGTVYVAATSTLLHQILQMPTRARRRFARDFCDYMPHVPNSASAIGIESIFFTLATDPKTAKILFDFAPLTLWLGRVNTEPENRSAGAAYIDLSSQPPMGGLFSREKVSAMMKDGAFHGAVTKRPAMFPQALRELADAYVLDVGTAAVKFVDNHPANQLQPHLVDGLDSAAADPDAVELAWLVADLSSCYAAYDANPRTWSAGTWAKAFTALGLMIVGGALLFTGAAPAGLWALNAALFAIDAAVMNWADSALASPALTTSNHKIPDFPEAYVLVEVGTVTALHIDEGPDATPVQPPSPEISRE